MIVESTPKSSRTRAASEPQRVSGQGRSREQRAGGPARLRHGGGEVAPCGGQVRARVSHGAPADGSSKPSAAGVV